MDVGVFDHLDRYDLPLADYYEDRLRLIEAYEAAGFHAYHVAEHHATPLGMASSPSVFLAAVAERTRRLRFGPMVYALPLYHPLRMIEEICMLDQMSEGRLDLGFGRGSSPVELEYFGEKPAEAPEVYAEALEVVLAGLTTKTLSHSGKRFHFDKVPIELEPYQKPHPPLWYGVHAPDSAERAARRGFHTVNLDRPADVRACTERFIAVWRETRGAAPLPKLGLGRFIVVGESDAEALALARRAYPVWYKSFTHLFRRSGRGQAHPRPPDFDGVMAVGQGVAGAPETVAAALNTQLAETRCNYVVGQFAFGDLRLSECLRSLSLFKDAVMPKLVPSSGALVP